MMHHLRTSGPTSKPVDAVVGLGSNRAECLPVFVTAIVARVTLSAMWRTAALFALAAFAAAKEEDKKIDGPVIGIDLGPWLHSSP